MEEVYVYIKEEKREVNLLAKAHVIYKPQMHSNTDTFYT